MAPRKPQVVLISADPALRKAVQQHRPRGGKLSCPRGGALAPGDYLHNQLWVDLESPASEVPAGRFAKRVYFYRGVQQPVDGFPPGLYIRKPCAPGALQMLWADAVLQSRDPTGVRRKPEDRQLPGWLLDFHEIELPLLCRKIVSELPARLGYTRVSLYLYEAERGLLTLAESNHSRVIEAAIRADEPRRRLMAAVAQCGHVLRTSSVRRAYRRLRVGPNAHGALYPDESCLVAPLLDRGQLWGVLNLSGQVRTPLTDVQAPVGFVLRFLAASLRQAREFQRAQSEARRDALTDLHNYRGIIELLEREVERTRRYGAALSLLNIDLDELKRINDRFGHAGGDAALRHVAARIRAGLRTIDTAARLGGDEFLVVLPETNRRNAEAVGRRILSLIRQDAPRVDGAPMSLSASIGLTQWRKGWSAAQLLEASDAAMYAAKQRGRGQLVTAPSAAERRTGLALASVKEQSLGPATGEGMRPLLRPVPRGDLMGRAPAERTAESRTAAHPRIPKAHNK